MRLKTRTRLCFYSIIFTHLTFNTIFSQFSPPNLTNSTYTKGYFAESKSLLVGQCTWYVYGRIQETGLISSTELDGLKDRNGKSIFLGDAPTWLNDTDYVHLKYGNQPKVGAIAVWTNNGGHVAFVEKVNQDSSFLVSESNSTPRKGYDVIVGSTHAMLMSDHSTNANPLWDIPQFTLMHVIDDPVKQDGYKWYFLSDGNSHNGWCSWLSADLKGPADTSGANNYWWNFTRIQLAPAIHFGQTSQPKGFIYLNESNCSIKAGQGSAGDELLAFQNAYQKAGGLNTLGCAIDQVEINGFTSAKGTTDHFQVFYNGSIEYMTLGPFIKYAFALVNPVYQKWISFGRTSNNLFGYPIENLSSETASSSGTSFKYQTFEQGEMIYHLSGIKTGLLFEIHGAILNKWVMKNAALSTLGLPVSDEHDALISGATGNSGRVSDFEKGHIYWITGGLTAFETHEPIDNVYIKMGGTASWLGFPISDVFSDPSNHNYDKVNFEGGYISTLDGTNYKAFPNSSSSLTISGRVIDSNNTGLNSIAILLSGDKSSSLTTDANGYYTITNLSSRGTYEVTPFKNGYDFNPASRKYIEQRQNQTADFVGTQKLYNITCGASPQSGGVTQGDGYFAIGKLITLIAKPNDGWSFVNWTQNGVQQNTDVNYTFTVYDNRNLIANFRRIPQYYTINCISNPLEGGNTSGCDTYLKNTQINLHAIANAGYQFTNWAENGNVESTNPFYSFNVDRNRNLVANFSLIPYGETITKPNQPFGQSIGVANKSYEFYLGGAISNYSDKVQYYVDWGDGSNSGWLPIGTTILQHSWNSPGIYNIKDQARCATHTNIISEWSNAWAINVTAPNSNWTVKHNGGSDLRSVFFIDANNGWVVGVQSIILHTIDSGNTWISQNSPVSFCSFYSIFFTDQNNGWICGSNNNTLGGIIIHTTDGGNNWTIQYNDSGSPNVVRWITAMNNNELFAAWNNGFLYTYDNGNTWQSKIMSPLSKIRKGTGNDIWATTIDGKIIYSNNFGNDWITKYTPPSGNNILDIASYGSNVWGVGALPYFKIIYSGNDGNSWQEQSSGGVPTLRGVYFIDGNNGWAVGDAILYTRNGGQLWYAVVNPTSNLLYDVYNSNGIVWAVGDQGTVLKYVDTTSVQVTINSVPVGMQITVDGTGFTTPATFTWNKNSIHTIGTSPQQSEGSDKRYIWNNWSDGGTISHTITASSNLTYTANFITQYSITVQSNDGGTINLQSNWFNEGQTVSFQATPNNGYKFVYWTENGKEVSQNEIYTFIVSKSRTLLASFALADYKVILNVEPSNGGVPDGYGVYNNGQVVTISAVPNSEFNFVNWTESGNIVQTNSSFPVTITKDRTLVANFSVKPSLVVKPGVLELNETSGTSQLNVSNSREGTMNWYAVADSNWLYITSGNSGTNSGVINLGYQANLSSVMKEGTITVTSIGSIGSPMIIKVRQRGAVTAVENETKLPNSFMLYQNYPNPFNPTTSIKYSLAQTSLVNLSIYDVLGRKVETLVDKEQSLGNYEVEFDGSNLASGVYFYRLHAGDFYATKKLTLVK